MIQRRQRAEIQGLRFDNDTNTTHAPNTVPKPDIGSDQRLPTIITPIQRRLIEANSAINQRSPDRLAFMHSVMCQVGLPRSRTAERSFERRNGYASVLLEAGSLYDGMRFVDMPLPYGAVPRLVLAHISSEAVRTKRREIEIGSSMRQFLLKLGMQPSGGRRGGYGALARQMEALAACRLTLGMHAHGRVVTLDAKPIKRFEAWLQQDGGQTSLWPGMLELSEDFYETLAAHAVPLDEEALAALKHSSLALDIYAWLAHRLCRVTRPDGCKLSWTNLRNQFGQEYSSPRDFKKQFKRALRQVTLVYPDARIDDDVGGLLLYPSQPPLPKTFVGAAIGSSPRKPGTAVVPPFPRLQPTVILA